MAFPLGAARRPQSAGAKARGPAPIVIPPPGGQEPVVPADDEEPLRAYAGGASGHAGLAAPALSEEVAIKPPTPARKGVTVAFGMPGEKPPGCAVDPGALLGGKPMQPFLIAALALAA